MVLHFLVENKKNPPRTIMYSIKKRLYAKTQGCRRKLQGNRRNKHGLSDRQQNCPYQLPQLAKEAAFLLLLVLV